MFRFANPYMLYALLLVAAAVVALFLTAWLRRRALARFGNAELVRTLMPDVSQARVRLKSVLLLTAMTLVIIALARPQFGARLKEEKMQGIEMMLVVDVSNSMLAEDLTPSRLERTRYAIDKLFGSLDQDRVGMVVFAGEAKVQLPITSDYRMARSFAKKLSPQLVSAQGTQLGQALSLARMSFSTEEGRSRAMILITDGEAHDSAALEQARAAAEAGIRIYAIGIGTPEGAPIKIDGEFIRDEKGDMVVSRLGEQMLQQIAEASGGGYIRATNAAFGLEEIVRGINEMERGESTTLRFEEYNEQFYIFLAVALALLLLESLLLDRRNPRLARFNIFRAEQ